MLLLLLLFCPQLLSGGSVDGAAFLAAGKADIAFNWAGRCYQAANGLARSAVAAAASKHGAAGTAMLRQVHASVAADAVGRGAWGSW